MKKTIKYLALLLLNITLFISCSDDDTNDDVSISTIGEVKMVMTLNEAPEDWSMQINFFPLTDYSEGIVTATYVNTGESSDSSIIIGTTDFDMTSAAHTIKTTQNANGLTAGLLFPTNLETTTVEVKLEFYFDNILQHTELEQVTFGEGSYLSIEWTTEDGYSLR